MKTASARLLVGRGATTASARLLVGRKIVAVDLRPFHDGYSTHHNPVFTLDNGARITFCVSEPQPGASFGVTPTYHKAKIK